MSEARTDAAFIPVPCRGRPRHLGAPVDASALNRAAALRLSALSPGERGGAEADCLIVPGFTPRLGWRSLALHPRPAESCARAASDLARGLAGTIIVTGGAVHGPANEAVLMRDALLARGVPEDRILVEPCARHTTTNLRNAARIMAAYDLHTALVVCPDGEGPGRALRQAFYIGHPDRSSFDLRCRLVLGYRVGALRWVRPWHVHFTPSPRCAEESLIPTLEGDP